MNDEIHLALPLDRHAEPLHTLVNAERGRIAAWLSAWDTVSTVADERARLRSRRAGLADAKSFSYVIEVNDDVAGTLALEIDHEDHAAEIGYMLAQRFERRGIITLSVAAVIDAAIKMLGVHRFEIRCAPENQRSCGVARRLGFTHEGTLRDAVRAGGRLQDQHVFALLATDWRDLRGEHDGRDGSQPRAASSP